MELLGYSFFFNTHLPLLDRKLSLFARYDHFDPDVGHAVTSGDAGYDLVISGTAWEFFPRCLVLLAYERVMYQRNNAGLGNVPQENSSLADDWKGQAVLQIAF